MWAERARQSGNTQQRRWHQWVARLVIACVGLMVSSAMAQERPSPPADTPKSFSIEILGPDEAIWLRENDLGQRNDPERVIIPKAQWEKMRAELDRLQQPAVDWSVTRFELTGTLRDDLAELVAKIGVRVDNPNGAIVDLQMAQSHWTHAVDADGKLPEILRTPGGSYRLAIRTPGVYEYTVNLFADVERGPAGNRLTLTLPEAPIKSVRLTCDQDVDFAGAELDARRYQISADRRTIVPALRANESLDITWRQAGQSPSAASSDLIVDGTIIYRLFREILETHADLLIESKRRFQPWVIRLPKGERVHGVQAFQRERSLDCQFHVSELADDTRVEVRLGDAAPEAIRVHVETERDVPADGALQLGRLEVENAQSQSGVVLVHPGPDLLVHLTPRRGLRSVSPAQLDPDVRRDRPLRAFRYLTQPTILDVLLEDAQPIVSASVHTEMTVANQVADLVSRFRFSIRRAHTESLRIRVPTEMRIESVGPPDLVEISQVSASDSAGSKDVYLALANPTKSEIEITLQSSVPLVPNGPSVLRLPTAGPEVPCTGTLSIRAARDVLLTLNPESMEHLIRLPPPRPSGNGWTASDRPLYFFRHVQGSPRVGFQVRKQPRSVEARIQTHVGWSQPAFRIASRVQYQSRNEPLEQIAIEVPASATGLRIEGDGIVIPPTIAPGTNLLSLAIPAERCEARVEYQYAPADPLADEGTLPLIVPGAVQRSEHRVSITGPPGRRGQLLPPWQPMDVKTMSPPTSVAEPEWLIDAAPSEFVLRWQKTATLVPLVIERVSITQWLGASRQRSGAVRMLVSSRRGPSMGIRIPDGCRLHPPSVDGKPATVVMVDNRLCEIALPAGSQRASVEIPFDFPESQGLGAIQWRQFEVPHIVGEASIDEVRWSFQTARKGLWWLPVGRQCASDVGWRFLGVLQPAFPSPEQSDLDRWVREGDPSVPWSEQAAPPPGAIWTFRSFADASSISLLAVDEPFWVLIASGLSLVAGYALSRATARKREQGLIAIVVGTACGFAIAPNTVGWIWAGAQWGVGLWLATWACRWLLASRRRPWATTRTAAPTSPTISSLLRRIPAETSLTGKAAVEQA